MLLIIACVLSAIVPLSRQAGAAIDWHTIVTLRDRFLHLLLIIACVLSAIVPLSRQAGAAIDWHTIVTL
ncbi:hypothetical protein CKJ90_32820, partial [Klebsiella pneumoniae]